MKTKGIWMPISVLIALSLLIGSLSCAAPTPTPKPTATATPIPAPKPTATATPTPTPKPTSKPPAMVVLSSFEPGAISYINMIGIGYAIEEAYGTKVRVVPASDTPARLRMIQTGKAFSASEGGSSYFAAEGSSTFATIDWGPQPFQIFWHRPGQNGVTIATTKTSGIKRPSDLKGKRIGVVTTAASHLAAWEGWLAFGNLTWKDVTVVKYSAYVPSIRGLLAGECDAAYGWGVTPEYQEVQASPKGLVWVPLPFAEKDAWVRLQNACPIMAPFVADDESKAFGTSKANPVELASQWSPIMPVYPSQVSDELVYFMVKAFDELYPKYKDKTIDLATMDIKTSLVAGGIAPYHPSVVRYLKEKGIWNADYDKFQDGMTKRQQLLLKTWDDSLAQGAAQKLTTTQIQDLWLKNREAALQANFPAYPGAVKPRT